ncbi:MAG TPA: phosphate ABC transporter permease subunit PstC [Acidimicrobiales bacterium]|jgi:phosphate transport system permease protein
MTVGSAGIPAPGTPHVSTTRRTTGVVRRVVEVARAHEEGAWRWSARVAAVLPLAALVFALTVLVIKAFPAIKVNGIGFLSRSTWNPGSGYGTTVHSHGVAHPAGSSYGAWPLIAGTLQTSVIALVIAVPISIGGAFALTERLPGWISRPLGLALEVLAGIPSVVIGLWGLLTLGPILAHDVYPILGDHMPDVPVLDYFRNPVGSGEGLLTAGIVLALMIIPIVASTTRDLFTQVPPLPKEGGEALGMTDWEVANRVTIPWVRSGIIGATALGLGRAIGETMAVALITGSILGHTAANIYSPMSTIAATILSQLDGAQTDGTGFAVATLAELGLILAVMSVAVNVVARLIVARTSGLAAPVGRA